MAAYSQPMQGQTAYGGVGFGLNGMGQGNSGHITGVMPFGQGSGMGNGGMSMMGMPMGHMSGTMAGIQAMPGIGGAGGMGMGLNPMASMMSRNMG